MKEILVATAKDKAFQAYNDSSISKTAYYIHVIRTTNQEKIATSKAALNKHKISTIPLSSLLPYALEIVEETNATIQDNAEQKLKQLRQELKTYSHGIRTFNLLVQTGAICLNERFQYTQELIDHLEKTYTPCKNPEDFMNALFSDNLVKVIDPQVVGNIMNATVIYSVDDTELGLGFIEGTSDKPFEPKFRKLTIREFLRREEEIYTEPDDRILAIALRSTAIQILQTEREHSNNGQLSLKPFNEDDIQRKMDSVLDLPFPGPEAADYYKAVGPENFIRRFYELLDPEESEYVTAISHSYIYNIQQDWKCQNPELKKLKFPNSNHKKNIGAQKKNNYWSGSLIQDIGRKALTTISDILIPIGHNFSSRNIIRRFLTIDSSQDLIHLSARGDKLVTIFTNLMEIDDRKSNSLPVNQDGIVIAVVSDQDEFIFPINSNYDIRNYNYHSLIRPDETTANSDTINPIWQDPRFANLDRLVADHGIYILNASAQTDETYNDFLNTALTLLINIEICGTNQQVIIVGDSESQNWLRQQLKNSAAAGYSSDPEDFSCHFIEGNELNATIDRLIAQSSTRLGGNMLVNPHALSLPVDLTRKENPLIPINNRLSQSPNAEANFSCLPLQLIGSASYINYQDLEAAKLFLKTLCKTLVDEHKIVPIIYEGGGYTSYMAVFTDCPVTFIDNSTTYLVPHQACTETQIANAERGNRFQGLGGAMVNGLAARTHEVLKEPGVLLKFPGGIGSKVEEIGQSPQTVAVEINMGGFVIYELPDMNVDLSSAKTDRALIKIEARKLAGQIANDPHCLENIQHFSLPQLQYQWGAISLKTLAESIRSECVTRNLQRLIERS